MDDMARTAPSPWRRDLAALAVLLLLAGGVRAWVVWNTAVPARDSVGFMRYALFFEELGWTDTLEGEHQHPGYPLTILAVSMPVRDYLSETADSMQLSAQLASSLAGLLLVVPMFYLGKQFFDRFTAFWGALLFQALPTSGQMLSDAVSDPLYLLMLATALLFAVRAVQGGRIANFALAGFFCGLAYLVRPEAVVVLAACGLVLIGMQMRPGWRMPRRRWAMCAGSLVLAALAAGSPYYLTVWAFTNKPNVAFITGEARAEPPAPPAQLFAAHFSMDGDLPTVARRSAWALGKEFAHCYLYVGWVPVLLGAWWYRRRFLRTPDGWLLIAACLLQAALVCRLGTRAGYISERHVLLLVLCTVFQAVAALRDLPAWLAALCRRPRPVWLSAPAWSLMFLLAFTGAGLSKTLQPLHADRAGHHAAGLWLARNASPADVIEDDHSWATFYAGRVVGASRAPQGAAQAGPPRRFIVINRPSERRPPSHEVRLSEAQVQAQGGRAVYHWPEHCPCERSSVVVYQMPKR